jgi:sarcosine oxidase
MGSYDVIVIGLGGMGSAAAFHLANRGVKVLGLEQFTPAHTRGSSHGHSRVIRQAYFEDPAYVPLLIRAYELWDNLQTQFGEQLLFVTGGLMIGERSSDVFQGSLRSAREHDLVHEVLDADAIRRRFPELAPTTEVGLFESVAGIVRPEAAVRAHLQLAESYGAELHFEEPVVTWRATANHVEVRTQSGTYEAGRLIVAPGAWASQLFQQPLPLRVTQQTLYWFEPYSSLDLFRPPHFPIYIWQTHPGDEFYGFPALSLPGDPGGVKVAYFYRNLSAVPGEPTRPISNQDIEEMRSILRDRIPNLPGKLIHATRCLYTETPDHHFVICQHTDHSHVILASPCSGHGFKFCSVVGEILADLAFNGTTRHPIELFDPKRFS